MAVEAQGLGQVKSYMCLICGFIYSEAAGRPEEGIPPGTKWEDIPLSWRCPDCGSGKEDFEMVEV
jgi:rubredoxin